jgi:hypothetical protein
MNTRRQALIGALILALLPAASAPGAGGGQTASPPAPKKPEKWIGVNVGPILPGVRPHLKKQLAGLPDGAGLTVFHVMPESPAVVAGLQQYDVLLRADGQPLTGVEKLKEALNQRNFGTSVRLDIIHEGQPKTVYALVWERPANDAAPALGLGGGGPVSIMILGGDSKGALAPGGATKVNQKLTYTDASGQQHVLTGDQVVEFHKRMREDEAFRKSVRNQTMQMEVQSEAVTSGPAGTTGASVITIQTQSSSSTP